MPSGPQTGWPPPGINAPEPTRLGETPWLEPYPDILLDGLADAAAGPEARYETQMTDVVEFQSPLGPAGWIADRLVLDHYMPRLLRHRNTWLKASLEAAHNDPATGLHSRHGRAGPSPRRPLARGWTASRYIPARSDVAADMPRPAVLPYRMPRDVLLDSHRSYHQDPS
jgi:hypothetical protein